MINVTINDTQIKARLVSMSQNVRQALKTEIYRQAVDLQKYIITEKLQAPPGYSATLLHRVSGNLARSIQQEVRESATEIQGRVYSDGSVDYAAIHEYGGVINRYGRKVGDYQIRMPERSFMRSSLRENKDNIVAALQQAVTGAARKK